MEIWKRNVEMVFDSNHTVLDFFFEGSEWWVVSFCRHFI